MTREKATNILKAKLECLKRETSGTDFDCNNSNCDECSLCYEQGNMGEQKLALYMAIEALEPKPYEKFESAKDHIYKLAGDYKCWDNRLTKDEAVELCHILEQQPVRIVSVFSDKICEGISCDECSFNKINDESGCLLQKRLDELPSFGELKSCKV